MTTGTCLCGAVRYEVQGPYRWMSHCHCSMCRKHYGTLHGTLIGAESSRFHWLQGEDAIVHYRASDVFERPFCKHCGSALPDVSNNPVVIPAGTLEGEIGIEPQAHIFVASKSPMYEFHDSLPRFDEYPPGYGVAVVSQKREANAGDSAAVHGSCLCGEVAFAIDTPPQSMVNCHCSRCRCSRGTAHGTNVFTLQEQLHWLRGAEHVQIYKVPDAFMFTTSFCKRCGSLLPALFEKIKSYLVPVGALDSPLNVKSGVHIYTDFKAPWFRINDSKTQFGAMPPRERFAEIFF